MLFPLMIASAIAFGFSFIPELIKNNRVLSLLWVGLATSISLGVSVLVLAPSSEIKKIVNLKYIINKNS